MTQRSPMPEHNSYRLEKRQLSGIRWMLFFVVAVQIAATAAAGLAASFFESPWVYPEVLAIELLAYFLPLTLYAKDNRLLTQQEVRNRFGLRPFRPGLTPLIVLAGFGCQFIMVVLDLPMNLILSRSDGYLPQNLWELLAGMAVVALIPAVFEELLFRGIVYGVMADLNTRAALIFTSVMFALMHGSAAGLLGYLFLGAALALVLRRTGSLYACILFHLVNNMTALLLSYFSPRLLETPAATIWLFAAGILAFAGAAGVLLLLTPKAVPRSRMKTSELLGQSFVSLPILLCMAGVLWLMIQ